MEIKSKIDNYIGFDSDEMFKACDLILIFGGALRDIISNQQIQDVDILVGSKSIKNLQSVLIRNGYKYMEDFVSKDVSNIYEINVICEPHTWMNGDRIIQIIRPSGNNDSQETYIKNLLDLVKNVDISCCGLSYNGISLKEDYPNALLHCYNKVFSVNKSAKMYSSKRISNRIDKLQKRGWELIENTIQNNRDLKIKMLVE
jgi:hypothetical protein